MSTLEKVQLLEERIKKAVSLIDKLKSENSALKDEVDLLSRHNEELKQYTSDYTKNSKEIEEGLTSALSQLEKLESSAVQPPQDEQAPPETPDEDLRIQDHGDEAQKPGISDEDTDAPLY